MNLLKILLALLGVNRTTSIDQITKPMARIVTKLEAFADEQKAASEADAERAKQLSKLAHDKSDAARRATDLAKRYSSLTV